MTKKSEQMTLNELRDKSSQSNSQVSFGKEMSGYNKKQVHEYINTLTENLQNAEESFNNRLEDYSSMITMLKQERDQYGEMYNICKNSKIEMANQIDELKKENDELNRIVNELTVNTNDFENKHLHVLETEPVIETQNQLEQYLNYEQESTMLKEQLDQLKVMVRELNDELENYANDNQKTNDPEVDFIDSTIEEKRVLKNQYEDVLRERNALLSEKNRLGAENKKLLEDLDFIKEENDQLINLKNEFESNQQTSIPEYEAKVLEYINNHQKTMNKLGDNIKISMDLIGAENSSLSNMLKELFSDKDI